MLDQIQDFLSGSLGSSIADLIVALLILVIGYILARVIAGFVRRLLGRTKLDNRLADALSEPDDRREYAVEELIGKLTFWALMLFVLVAFFEHLGLARIAEPISTFLEQLTASYLPRLGGAIVLLILAWLLATVLRFLVHKGATILKLDERLTKYGALEEGERVSVSEPLSKTVFWLVFLFFLPAVLNALGLTSIAEPVQGIFDEILGYVPNILAAAVVLLIGWFGARILRSIVTGLLAAIGVNRYGARAGLPDERPLSDIIGNVLYLLIWLIVIIAALDQLNFAAISEPATQMLTTIVDAIPAIVGAVIVLVVAYAIARLVAALVRDLLASIGFNRLPDILGIQWSSTITPADWIGHLTQVVIMLFAASAAVEMLGSAFLVNALNVFIGFLGTVLLAAIILAIGIYFANLAYKLVVATETNNAMFLGRAARIVIVAFAAAVALRELGIANDIINLAFGITLGAVAVAAALAFGLGGREAAGREVDRFVTAMRSPAGENDNEEATAE